MFFYVIQMVLQVHNDDEVRALFKQVQGEVPGSPIFIMKVASQVICDKLITALFSVVSLCYSCSVFSECFFCTDMAHLAKILPFCSFFVEPTSRGSVAL